MKRLLTLLAILVTFNAYSQNTTTLPTPTASFTPSFRYYGTLLDSLRQTWMQTPGGGWNRMVTMTEANLRYAPYGSGVNSFNGRRGAVTLLNTDVTGALGYTPENTANKTDIISSSTTQYTTPKAVLDYTYSKVHIDSAINNASTQNYDFSAPTTGTATITNASLIGMYVYQVVKSGVEYDIITSGTPSGNSVFFNGTTGALTFADNFNTSASEKGHVRYKSIVGLAPTAPPGVQILYADNYATASGFATGTGNKMIFVRSDEVNLDDYESLNQPAIYTYINGVLTKLSGRKAN